jgi:hypothetical protein
MSAYTVEVYTGDVRGAGTDARVSITMVGDRGAFGPHVLGSEKKLFERGTHDTFSVNVSSMSHFLSNSDNFLHVLIW